jgi:hypothetical protein
MQSSSDAPSPTKERHGATDGQPEEYFTDGWQKHVSTSGSNGSNGINDRLPETVRKTFSMVSGASHNAVAEGGVRDSERWATLGNVKASDVQNNLEQCIKALKQDIHHSNDGDFEAGQYFRKAAPSPTSSGSNAKDRQNTLVFGVMVGSSNAQHFSSLSPEMKKEYVESLESALQQMLEDKDASKTKEIVTKSTYLQKDKGTPWSTGVVSAMLAFIGFMIFVMLVCHMLGVGPIADDNNLY